jgi:hypothetical protein
MDLTEIEAEFLPHRWQSISIPPIGFPSLLLYHDFQNIVMKKFLQGSRRKLVTPFVPMQYYVL